MRSNFESKIVDMSKEEPLIELPITIKKLIDTYGFLPDTNERPKRCRAIIYNPDGTKVLVIVRKRPGRDIYAVYPGGGLEDDDVTAKDGVWRELNEELGLTQEQVLLGDYVIQNEGEFFYIGIAADEYDGLAIGGPEAERSEDVSGTYTPTWIPATDLNLHSTFPEEISNMLVDNGSER